MGEGRGGLSLPTTHPASLPAFCFCLNQIQNAFKQFSEDFPSPRPLQLSIFAMPAAVLGNCNLLHCDAGDSTRHSVPMVSSPAWPFQGRSFCSPSCHWALRVWALALFLFSCTIISPTLPLRTTNLKRATRAVEMKTNTMISINSRNYFQGNKVRKRLQVFLGEEMEMLFPVQCRASSTVMYSKMVASGDRWQLPLKGGNFPVIFDYILTLFFSVCLCKQKRENIWIFTSNAKMSWDYPGYMALQSARTRLSKWLAGKLRSKAFTCQN